jgi:DNA-directed RNA polymerase subunit RPC12/RpoP
VTYEHKYKCMRCGLHFTLYSWQMEREQTPTCPECENKKNFMYWVDETEQQIYEFVPGGSPLSRIHGIRFEEVHGPEAGN